MENKKVILIVEDYEPVRVVLSLSLGRFFPDCEIVAKEYYEETADFIRKEGAAVKIALLDNDIHGRSGWEIAALLRGANLSVFIFSISGKPFSQVKERHWFNGFLQKPFEEDELFGFLKQWTI